MATSTQGFAGRLADLVVAVSSSSTTGTNLGGMRDVTFDATHEPIDFTNFDSSGWKQYIAGERGWTLTAGAVVLSTAVAANQNTLRDVLSSGTRKYFHFKNSTAAGAQTFKGWGYVTGWSQAASRGEPQIHNFSVQGDSKYVEA